MNVAEFSEWITCKVNCKLKGGGEEEEKKGKKKEQKSHKSEFKIPPYGSTLTIKFK
jgi:hypothetical protein